jgi:UDP-3-O-[3-hydroxymyristoyl] glucosamine N-acyltransferase
MGYPAVPRARAFEQHKGLARLKRLFVDVADLKTRLRALDGLGKAPVVPRPPEQD